MQEQFAPSKVPIYNMRLNNLMCGVSVLFRMLRLLLKLIIKVES
jgi:hypothetical protein